MVRSGSEALREMLQREFAVILLDVNMPDIDGLETARLIRQYKKSAHTPIIFITAYADEMQTAQGYSLGAVDYILSPVIPDVLRSKVQGVRRPVPDAAAHRAPWPSEQVARAQAEAARVAAEETTRRSNFLARASHELGASLDLEQGMRRLLDLVVPQIADAAALVVDADAERPLAVPAGRHATADPRVDGYGELPERAARGAAARGARGPAARGRDGVLPAAHRRAHARRAGAGFDGLAQPAPQDLVDAAGAGRAAPRSRSTTRASTPACSARSCARAQAEESLQDANRRKDEFLAMLSHELRNPLAPIRNAVEVIRRLAPPDPKLTMARDVVDRQVTLLARLVEELLDVSRISQGKIALKKEPVELGAHHRAQRRDRAAADRRARPDAHACRCRRRRSGCRPTSRACRRWWPTCSTTPSKYTAEGGRIELTAERAARARRRIAVRDNGAGIEPQLLPKVFDLFVQGDRSLDRGQGGLGIGLTLVKRLVELHQGRVEAASDGPGQGRDASRVDAALHQRGRAAAPSAPRSASSVPGAPRSTAGGCWWSTTTSTPPRAPRPSCASRATR